VTGVQTCALPILTSSLCMRVSVRIFSALICLYPAEYQTGFGSAKVQLFSDQCREANRRWGCLGILATWVSAVPGLVWSLVREHGASPESLRDLVAPNPMRELPWKSTALVLLPGVFLFACQVAGIFGADWYFNSIQQIGCILMAPVAVVWWRTRTYPVWGLVPLGLAFFGISRVFPVAFFIRIYKLAGRLPANPLEPFLPYASTIAFAVAVAFFVATLAGSVFFLAAHARWMAFSRHTKAALSACAILLAGYWVYTFSALWWIYTDPIGGLLQPGSSIDIAFLTLIFTNWVDILFTDTVIWLILLAVVGTVFSRRYGNLSVLILLGFVLPTVIFGHIGPEALIDPWMLGVIPVILVWRLLMGIVAPLLLLRASSPQRRAWIVLPPLAIALGARLWLVAAMQWTAFLPDLSANMMAGSFALVTDIFTKLIFPFVIITMALSLFSASRPAPEADLSL
jgi:hypothetical protein